ncbi:MAG: hypothetical protein A2Z81_08995 [Omnitrophica WOR_2 bacterium GWA2_45_18]|nr:MAG: hypothetical protein A2Z81_08995 [Omnitrophica WOR_2 bacterium GWA2_45_18]
MTKSDAVALGVCVLAYFFWADLLTNKFYSLGYYDWDFDLAAQTMWNLCHGSTRVSLYGTNFLANHSEYFAFLLVPVYSFFQHPLTLIHLNLLSFFGGAFVFYRIAQKNIGSWMAICFMTLFIIHPANIFMLLYEFHFESLAIGFLFLLFYFYREEKFRSFMIVAVLMSLLKENMPPLVAMFGIHALFGKKDKMMLWSLTPFLLGVVLFTLEMFVLTPYFRREFSGQNNIYWGAYSQLGGSPVSIIQFFFFHPWQVVKMAANEMNLYYVRDLFGPLIALAFFSPHILFLGFPVFMQNLLSGSASQHTIYFHYAAPLVVFIFMAAVNTWTIVKSRFRLKIVILVIAVIVLTSVFHTFHFQNQLTRRLSFLLGDRLNPIRWQMINHIPKDAGVVSTFNLLDPLSQRENLYALYNVWLDANLFTGRSPFQVPEEVAYALIDFNDPWLHSAVLTNPSLTSERLRKFLLDPAWSVHNAIEDVVLFRKGVPGGLQLVEVNANSVPQERGIHLTVDDRIELLSLKISQEMLSQKEVLPVTFYLKAKVDVGNRYRMRLVLTKENRIYYKKDRDIGYLLFPTSVWKKDDMVKEYYAYWLPGLGAGEYNVELLFFNMTKGTFASLRSVEDPRISNAVSVGKLKIP